jgi:hypothetical protein
VFVVWGDVADALVEPDGVVVLARMVSSARKTARVADRGQVRVLDLEVAEELSIQACSVWSGCRPSEVLGDRAQRHELQPPQDKNKAAVAVAHKLLIAAYYIMADNDAVYRELGADHVSRRDDPARRRDRLVARLANLGYDVELTPTAARQPSERFAAEPARPPPSRHAPARMSDHHSRVDANQPV